MAPFLVYFIGTDLHIAQATRSLSFIFTGVVGTILYARRKSIRWSDFSWIAIGVAPAALLGTRVNVMLSSSAVKEILAVLIIFSGVSALSKSIRVPNEMPHQRRGFVITNYGIETLPELMLD